MPDLSQATIAPFLATLFAMALYGVVHSLLASSTVKRTVKRSSGPTGERLYRLGYNLVAVVTLVPVLALPALFPGQRLYSIPPPWLWLTLGLQALSALTILIGLLQTGLGSFLGLTQLLGRAKESDELTTRGLYRWVRHPLYSAGLIVIWLLPVMTTSLLALNLGITAYLYFGSIFEERKLRVQFGADYERYQRQVPRLIPRPWIHDQDEA